MKKIVYLEGESTVRETIAHGFSINKNYQIQMVDNTHKMLSAVENLEPDACIIDTDLKGLDINALIMEILRIKQNMLILFCGLKPNLSTHSWIGSVNYLHKTLIFSDLFAQFEHHLFRWTNANPAQTESTTIHFGECSLDITNDTLHTKYRTQILPPKEAMLLKLLLFYEGAILPRTEALSLIWGKSDYFTARSMDVFISSLRKKLSSATNIKLKNHRGIGHSLKILI